MPTLSRRLLLALAIALALLWPAAGQEAGAAPAKPGKPAKPAKKVAKYKKTAAKKPAKKVAKRRCKGKKCRRGKFSGHGVAKSELRKTPLPKPSGRVVLRTPALHEAVDVNIFNEDGSYNQDALAKLDALFRCRRTGEERAVDPRLFEVLSILYDEYGKTIDLNSGFRYQRNEGSRHFHASAMDVQIDGVSYRELYKFAESLDRGGMGIGQYPRSGFVHIDFRAPGEPSYRWTDTSRSGGRDSGKLPSKMWKKPNS